MQLIETPVEQATESAKSPTQQFNENMGLFYRTLIKGTHRYLASHFIQVSYKPRCPYSYAVRRFKSGVLIETGMKLTHPQFDEIIERAALAAMEVLQERATCVAIRLPEHGD